MDGSSDNGNGGGAVVAEDRLSSLPEHLLVNILSHLPILTAIATSFLCRRWRHLWTQITGVNLYEDDGSYRDPEIGSYKHLEAEVFFTKCDNVLKKLTSSTIRTFRTKLLRKRLDSSFHKIYQSLIESWLPLVCAQNVEEVNISLNCTHPIQLPPCIFQCPSLISLTLEGEFYCELSEDYSSFCLPKLKYLYMQRCAWDCCPKLPLVIFKSCPVLETLELHIDDDDYTLKGQLSFDISCLNLKRLTIYMYSNLLDDCQFVIDTPQLHYIKIDSFNPTTFRFVSYPHGLLEADISSVGDDERAVALVQGISYTRSLKLDIRFRDLHYLDSFPHFSSMTQLQLPVTHCIHLLLILLQSPHLEAVETEYWNCSMKLDAKSIWSNSVPQCLLSTLKRIRVHNFYGREDEMLLLHYILKNAQVLELLDLVWRPFSEERETQMCNELDFVKELFLFPRSSSNCEMKFHGYYLSASNAGCKGSVVYNISYR